VNEPQLTAAVVGIIARLDHIEQALQSADPHGYTPYAGAASGMPEPSGVPDEIVSLVRAGLRLEAIKRYRALTGADLAQAKAVIQQVD
jgi:ribosomal protein L7/L12